MSESLFVRFLDLTPLHGRRTGKVLCPFHRERTPSFSVDLDAEVFHCFGCGVEGGRNEFERILIKQGALKAYEIAQRQPWAKPEAQALADVAERIKAAYRDVARLREGATDTPAGWARLEAAARLETLTRAAESEVDA
jgi:hypothetical protein